MPTKASRAATELAALLRAEGFAVTATAVQRWRERGLLGRWEHRHEGGPGSRSLAPPDALLRARIAARLPRELREPSLITLLSFALGSEVSTEEFVAAASAFLAAALAEAPDLKGGDVWEAASEAVGESLVSDRAARKLRRRSAALDGTPDPQHSIGEPDRTSVERARGVLVAGIAVLNGDVDEVVPVLADTTRLAGGAALVDAAKLDEPLVLAELAPALVDNATAMLASVSRITELDDEDLAAVRRAYTAILGGDEQVRRLADASEPINDPHLATSLLLGIVLSQLGVPGRLDAGLHPA